ncbi:hypothetical protein [Glaciimonas sp. PCH181]|uniref:hypothetical protein n=1 Tax=Glaciimonas sp. PCH181 TaxID=2133943 RepID=UPI0011B29D26|nr:hypothetical protein [Glaciimonas sp. PCH181]
MFRNGRKLDVGTVVGYLLVVGISAYKSKVDYDAQTTFSASRLTAMPTNQRIALPPHLPRFLGCSVRLVIAEPEIFHCYPGLDN